MEEFAVTEDDVHFLALTISESGQGSQNKEKLFGALLLPQGKLTDLKQKYMFEGFNSYGFIADTLKLWIAESPGRNRNLDELVNGLDSICLIALAEKIKETWSARPLPPEPTLDTLGKSIWFGMKSLVFIFTGRTTELGTIYKALAPPPAPSHGSTGIPKVAVIVGLGGVGKSELARKFAYTYKKDFQNIIWMNAETEQSLRSGFEKLANKHLRLKLNSNWTTAQLVEQVYKCKYFETKPSLFIFDNVECWKLGPNAICNYLPTDLSPDLPFAPSVLMTSRTRTWGRRVTSIPLEVLQVSEAVEHIKICLELESESPAELKAAQGLAKAVGCLPLTLQQAVAYILRSIQNPPIRAAADLKQSLNSTNLKTFCIQAYVDRLEEMGAAAELLDFQDPEGYGTADEFDKTTFITWNVTFEKIREQNLDATQLMAMCSYLEADNINLGIFLENDFMALENLEKAVQILTQYSMIRRELNIVSLHRLVQQVIRLTNRSSAESTLASLLEIFARIFATMEQQSNCSSPYLLSCIAHAHSVWQHCLTLPQGQGLPLLEKFEEFAIALFDKTEDCGLYVSCLSILEKTAAKYDLVFGAMSENNVAVKIRIVTMLWRLGRCEDAKNFGENLHAAILPIFGDGHPLVLDLLSTVAIVHNNMGHYSKALTIYDTLIAGYEASPNFGPNHVDTRSNRYNKADILKRLERYDEALEIFRSELAIELESESDSATPPDEVFVLDLEGQIAFTLQMQCNFAEALALHEKVFAKRKEILGEVHDYTVSSVTGIGECLCDLGRFGEAMGLLEKYLKMTQDAPGVGHERLIIKHIMARVLQETDKYEEAIVLLQGMLENLETFGETDPQVLNSKQLLGELLEAKGLDEEAMNLFEFVLQARIQSIGEEHVKTKKTSSCIARIQAKTQRKDKKVCQVT